MNGADGKKTEGKFTIQFSQTDPAHLQATGILNSKERRGKAQYIVNAILYYESHGGALDRKPTMSLDEKSIEAIADRILYNRKDGNTGILPGAAPSGQASEQPRFDEDITSGDTIEALGTDGINAVISAMEMFRMKQ